MISAYFFFFTLANIGFPPSQLYIRNDHLFTIAEENRCYYFVNYRVTLSAISGFFTFTESFWETLIYSLWESYRIFSDATSYEVVSLLPDNSVLWTWNISCGLITLIT